MPKLTITKQVQLSYTAEDWELYDLPGRNEAAEAMNKVIEEAINEGCTRSQVYSRTSPVFREFDDLGSRDSEPLGLLDRILDKVYGAH